MTLLRDTPRTLPQPPSGRPLVAALLTAVLVLVLGLLVVVAAGEVSPPLEGAPTSEAPVEPSRLAPALLVVG